jgi:outer membrane protein TolC
MMASAVRRLALLLGVLTAPVAAQSRGPLATDTVRITLDDALRAALSASQETRLARSEVAVARQQVRATRATVLPQLNGSVNYTRTFETPFRNTGSPTLPDSLRFEPDPTASIEERLRYLEQNAPNAGLGSLGSLFGNLPFGQYNTYVAALTLTQPVFAAGRVGAALKIANQYQAAAELGLSEQLSEIELRTRTAYVRAQLAVELERIADSAVTQADIFLRQERLRLDNGTASELDVLRAEVSAENLRPQLVEARNAAAVASLDLKRLLDIPASQPIALATVLTAPTVDEIAAARAQPRDLLDRRPIVLGAERTITIREQQVRIANSYRLPSVDLRINYGRQAFPATVFGFNGVDWRPDFTAVVGVQIPIFSGFRVSAELQQARIALDQERLKLTQLKENVNLQYEQALGERERAEASLAARQRTVQQAQRVHDLTVLQYEAGVATQLEVSDARLALLRSRTTLAQAIADFHLATAAIQRARGEYTRIQ